jgi:uncharacterized protein with NAD-binding domain and iron-sulfur cluster
MSNDFIIIGGGIAGLYTMYNILKKRPYSKIILIEKENILGGRIHTFNDKYMSVDAGAGRFHENNKLLIELITELGLSSKMNKISSSASYAPIDCSGIFMNSVLDAPKRELDYYFDVDFDIPLPGSQYSSFFLPFSLNLFEPIFKLGLDITLGTQNIPNAELILRVILASKGEPIKKLQNISFISYAKTILNSIEIDFIKSSFGYYSELVIMNAYDAIYLMEKHLSPTQQFYNLIGGLSQIIENLEQKILKFKNVKIIKNRAVSSIMFSKKDNEFIVNCRNVSGSSGGSGVSYTCKKCVCALPKNILEKLTIFNPIQGLIDKVQCAPLCRIYSKFPLVEKRTNKINDLNRSNIREPWFKGLTKLTTNNNLRMIIPIDEDAGIIMSSYTDNKYARFWKELFDTEGEQGINRELVRLLKQSTGMNIDYPIKTHIFYWNCGVGYWSIGANSEIVSKKMISPFPDLDLFICGENYSHHNQQWIEGALETSNCVVENLSL